MNTCTFLRMQAPRIAAVLLAASLSLPLFAQTARIYNNGSQSNLRIDVKVVPAAAIPDHDRDHDKDKDKDKDKGREDGGVLYNLNPQHEELSVTEETRPMLVDSGNMVRQEQVTAITVVPK